MTNFNSENANEKKWKSNCLLAQTQRKYDKPEKITKCNSQTRRTLGTFYPLIECSIEKLKEEWNGFQGSYSSGG